MIFLAATLIFGNPIPSDQLNIGPSAFYAESYDHGGWDQIIAVHRAAGQLPDDFAPSPEGYYCAHPDLPFGAKVHVVNAITGETVTCVVADRVAPRDKLPLVRRGGDRVELPGVCGGGWQCIQSLRRLLGGRCVMLIDDLRAAGKNVPETVCFDVTNVGPLYVHAAQTGQAAALRETTPMLPPYERVWLEGRFADIRGQSARYGADTLAIGADGEWLFNPAPMAPDDLDNALDVLRESIGSTPETTILMAVMGEGTGWLGAIVCGLDARGIEIQGTRDGQDYGLVYTPEPALVRHGLVDEAMQALRVIGGTFRFALSMLHVRNVTVEQVTRDEKLQRARQRRGKPPFVDYRVLRVVVPGTPRQPADAGARQPVQGVLPAHLVRGHFAHYGDERPLFGKYSGTFWVPSHARGNPEVGTVLKDYSVNPLPVPSPVPSPDARDRPLRFAASGEGNTVSRQSRAPPFPSPDARDRSLRFAASGEGTGEGSTANHGQTTRG